jgi:hypothetical protein
VKPAANITNPFRLYSKTMFLVSSQVFITEDSKAMHATITIR